MAHEVKGVDGAAGEVAQAVREAVIVQSGLLPAVRVSLAVEKVS